MFSPIKIRRFRRQLVRWFLTNRRDFPWRHTTDPFHVLVAEVLLQKTLAPKAVPAFLLLTRRYPTPRQLAVARIADLKGIVRPLGLLHRAHTLKKLARTLLRHHEGV